MPNNQQAQKLRDALKKSVSPGSHIMAGIASNIDAAVYTCTVTRANGTVYEDVQLKALKEITTGVVQIPKDSTWVHILEIGEPDYLVIACEEVDKYMLTIGGETLVIDKDGHVFDGGSNGGMVIIAQLLSNLNALKDYIKNTLEPNISSGLSAVGESTAASGTAAKAAFDLSLKGQDITYKDMENTKVKH